MGLRKWVGEKWVDIANKKSEKEKIIQSVYL
jgi:hypothetical protein